MLPKHPRAGEPHHGFDLFPLVPLVAMNWASCTGWFIFAESAPIQPHADLPRQLLTLVAQRVAVLLAAEDMDHRGNGFPLPREPAIGEPRGCERIDRSSGGIHLETQTRGGAGACPTPPHRISLFLCRSLAGGGFQSLLFFTFLRERPTGPQAQHEPPNAHRAKCEDSVANHSQPAQLVHERCLQKLR